MNGQAIQVVDCPTQKTSFERGTAARVDRETVILFDSWLKPGYRRYRPFLAGRDLGPTYAETDARALIARETEKGARG